MLQCSECSNLWGAWLRVCALDRFNCWTHCQLLLCPAHTCLSPHPQVRCAGAVWLVSLLLHCGRHPRLLPLLPDAQQALSQLLGDQNELTQVLWGTCCVLASNCIQQSTHPWENTVSLPACQPRSQIDDCPCQSHLNVSAPEYMPVCGWPLLGLQEMASRGLAAVYDMADEATRKALLDSLMATLSGEQHPALSELELKWGLNSEWGV